MLCKSVFDFTEITLSFVYPRKRECKVATFGKLPEKIECLLFSLSFYGKYISSFLAVLTNSTTYSLVCIRKQS